MALTHAHHNLLFSRGAHIIAFSTSIFSSNQMLSYLFFLQQSLIYITNYRRNFVARMCSSRKHNKTCVEIFLLSALLLAKTDFQNSFCSIYQTSYIWANHFVYPHHKRFIYYVQRIYNSYSRPDIFYHELISLLDFYV